MSTQKKSIHGPGQGKDRGATWDYWVRLNRAKRGKNHSKTGMRLKGKKKGVGPDWGGKKWMPHRGEGTFGKKADQKGEKKASYWLVVGGKDSPDQNDQGMGKKGGSTYNW